MKRRFFSTLLLAFLFLFALNVQGDISWKRDPMITSFPTTFTKYINILSGEVSWYYGGEYAGVASVWVSAELKGVGYGIATLKNVYLTGEPNIAIYGGARKDYVGTKDQDGHGSWRSGTGTVSVGRKVTVPDNAKGGDSWLWGAGQFSNITPTQYEWHETSSWGINISIPKGITGRYTTTGGWANGTLPQRTAPARSGTHTLKVKYICRKCNAAGKTKAEIGGKSAHA